MTDNDLITAQEVADVFRVSTRTIKRWAAEGDFIRPMRFSHKVSLFSRSELLTWIEGRKKLNKEPVE